MDERLPVADEAAVAEEDVVQPLTFTGTGREYFHVGLRRNTSCVSTLRKIGSDTYLVWTEAPGDFAAHVRWLRRLRLWCRCERCWVG